MGQDEIKELVEAIIKTLEDQVISVILYGSMARGDYNEDSDWDLLVLLDKPKKEKGDWDNYGWPFVEMGLEMNEIVSASTYTKDSWFNGPHAMFYYNVEEDKEVLYES